MVAARRLSEPRHRKEERLGEQEILAREVRE